MSNYPDGAMYDSSAPYNEKFKKGGDMFEKGQIVVALEEQRLSCCHINIYEGQICKVFNPEADYSKDILVYKNVDHEEAKNTSWAKETIFRIASDKEAEMYVRGVKNIKVKVL